MVIFAKASFCQLCEMRIAWELGNWNSLLQDIWTKI